MQEEHFKPFNTQSLRPERCRWPRSLVPTAGSGEPHDHDVIHEKEAPQWLLAFWREIDDKTFGDGFDCFAEDATCNLGVADWKGRETIRENLRAFIDTGFSALHDVTEYWDGGSLKMFRGTVTMTPDDRTQTVVKPVMTHFFYMDEVDPTKVRHWYGSVGPIAF
nr:nuclear transport factor 2 family protein [Rhizobium sp. RCAM05973]